MKNLIPYNLFEMTKYSADSILESIKKVYRAISLPEALKDIDSLKNIFLEDFDGYRFVNFLKYTSIISTNKFIKDSNINSFSNRAHTNVVKGIATKDTSGSSFSDSDARNLSRRFFVDWNIPILEVTDRFGFSIIKVEIQLDTDSFVLYIDNDNDKNEYYSYSYANKYSEEELWRSIFKKIKGYERINI